MSTFARRWAGGAAAVVLLAAAAAGLVAVVRLAPERTRLALERRLSAELGPVEMRSVRLAPAFGVVLEARDVKSAGRTSGEVGLAADRLRVQLQLPALLRGRLRVGRIAISGLRMEIDRLASGALRPEFADRLLRAARESEPPGTNGAEVATRRLAAAWEAVRRLPSIEVSDADVRLRTRDARGAAVGDPLVLRGARLSLRRARLLRTLEITAAGRLARGDDEGARFELAGSLPPGGEARATLTADGLGLGELQALVGRRAALAISGQASGRLDWRLASDGASQIEAGIELGDVRVRGRVGKSRRKLDARWPSATVSASLELSRSAIDARRLALDLGALELEGRARVGLPWRAASPVDLELSAAPVDVGALRDAVRALAPADAKPLRELVDAITAGRIGPTSLRAEGATRGALEAFARAPIAAWPEGLSLELALARVDAGFGAGEPLRQLSGRLSWRRDRLQLAGVRARLGDRPLPELDLTLEGVEAAIAALDASAAPAPVDPLPGRLALAEWIEAERKPGEPPRWKRADIEAERIAHPALLRPLEQVRAALWPTNPGIRSEVSEARWGGARITGRVSLLGGTPGHLAAELRAEIPTDAVVAAAAPAIDPEAWLRGRFRVELEKLGPLHAEWVVGEVRAVGARAEVRGGEAALRPRGNLSGEVDLDFSQREAVPYEARLRIADGSLPDLMSDVHLGGDAMTGSASLSGKLAGRLVAGSKILAHVTGPASLRLRDGEILRRMHLMLAIAAASDTFNPFRSRETLPYEAIDAELELDHGVIRATSMSLLGPAARLVGTGSVDAIHPPHELEAVVGLFFFRTLDTVISKMPLVNLLLLGSDDNLVAAYFALTGPWAEPRARVIPTRTLLTTGPAGIVTDGLPTFVRSGLSTLARLLGVGEKAEPPASEGAVTPP